MDLPPAGNAEPGVPPRALLAAVCRAVQVAAGTDNPGPVHINVQMREQGLTPALNNDEGFDNMVGL